MLGMEKMDLLFTRHRQCFIFRSNQLSKGREGRIRCLNSADVGTNLNR